MKPHPRHLLSHASALGCLGLALFSHSTWHAVVCCVFAALILVAGAA